jgi:hypothetical protein
MADEASVIESAYVDAIFDIRLNLGFSRSERRWEKGYVIAVNRHPQYGLTGVGRIDPEGRFHLTWLEIRRFEGAVLYSGRPIDFGTLAIHEDSFMDVFTSACLKGCSEDHECEISNLLENLISFTTPQAIVDQIRGSDYSKSAPALLIFTRWASIPSRHALQLSGWREFSQSSPSATKSRRFFPSRDWIEIRIR